MGHYPFAEQEAENNIQALSQELFLTIPDVIDQLAHDLLGVIDRQETHGKVAFMLLLRIKQELFAIQRLICIGLPVQALALCGNLVELAYELLYVRDDDTRAQKWADHREMVVNVWEHEKAAGAKTGLKARMRDGLDAVGLDEAGVKARVENDYKTYQILCAAKHGNPMMLMDTGAVIEDDDDSFLVGVQDYKGKSDQMAAVFAMHNAVEMFWVAGQAILEFQANDADAAALSPRLNSLREMNAIASAAARSRIDASEVAGTPT